MTFGETAGALVKLCDVTSRRWRKVISRRWPIMKELPLHWREVYLFSFCFRCFSTPFYCAFDPWVMVQKQTCLLPWQFWVAHSHSGNLQSLISREHCTVFTFHCLYSVTNESIQCMLTLVNCNHNFVLLKPNYFRPSSWWSIIRDWERPQYFLLFISWK